MAMDHLDRFVAVDVETTGVYDSDRIVEVAAVTVSADGTVVDEWDSLVNPGRDVGPTHIHGLTASMVSAAPCFEEVAEALAARVHGGVLVAHNLAFDARMLTNEYARVGAVLDRGNGVCTLSQCGQRLEDACAAYGVELQHHHRALADARATARLFVAASCRTNESSPAWVQNLPSSTCPRTLRREAVIADADIGMPYLARIAARSYHRAERGPSLLYLDMLDWVLDDLVISPEEWSELSTPSRDLGMTPSEVDLAHERYLRELVSAAARDGKITDRECGLLRSVVVALRLEPNLLEEAIAPFLGGGSLCRLQPDMRVCFTGAATYSDGREIPRSRLAEIARTLGLLPVDSVTKKSCDLVVAADTSSLSGKASKARAYGIPIADVRDFVCAEIGAEIPVL